MELDVSLRDLPSVVDIINLFNDVHLVNLTCMCLAGQQSLCDNFVLYNFDTFNDEFDISLPPRVNQTLLSQQSLR